jgi:hypothetical protein
MIMFFQALFALLVYDILSKFRPFKTLHSTVKGWKVAKKSPAQDTVDRVCSAVNYACAWYPKQALCLQRSFVATYLLRKYGVPAQMVLGAQKLPFKAHAWVEVNGRAVNERSSVQAYGVWERC